MLSGKVEAVRGPMDMIFIDVSIFLPLQVKHVIWQNVQKIPKISPRYCSGSGELEAAQ